MKDFVIEEIKMSKEKKVMLTPAKLLLNVEIPYWGLEKSDKGARLQP